MTGIAAGLTGFAVLLALMAIRIPIAVAMLAVGVGGYGLVNGWMPLLAYLKTNTYYQFSTYSLSVIPLFVLMGEFATHAGLSRALYRSAAAFLGRVVLAQHVERRGGVDAELNDTVADAVPAPLSRRLVEGVYSVVHFSALFSLYSRLAILASLLDLLAGIGIFGIHSVGTSHGNSLFHQRERRAPGAARN